MTSQMKLLLFSPEDVAFNNSKKNKSFDSSYHIAAFPLSLWIMFKYGFLFVY